MPKPQTANPCTHKEASEELGGRGELRASVIYKSGKDFTSMQQSFEAASSWPVSRGGRRCLQRYVERTPAADHHD